MIRESRLPPLFRLHPLAADADVAAEARRLAAAGAEPGSVLCADRENRLDAAVVLHPEETAIQASRIVYVATLGLGDAIGAEVPAGIDVTYRWPNIIDANVGSVAKVRLEQPDGIAPDDTPEWLVAHVVAEIGPLSEGWREGRFPETSLHDEGCVEVTAGGLLESFTRHFLTWINRWQDDGFEPVRAMWLRHAPLHGGEIEIELNGRMLRGVFTDIDDEGALILDRDGTIEKIGLDAALRDPAG